MREYLWLIPALPLMSFIVLTLPGKALPHRAAAIAGTAATGLTAYGAATLREVADFLAGAPNAGLKSVSLPPAPCGEGKTAGAWV